MDLLAHFSEKTLYELKLCTALLCILLLLFCVLWAVWSANKATLQAIYSRPDDFAISRGDAMTRSINRVTVGVEWRVSTRKYAARGAGPESLDDAAAPNEGGDFARPAGSASLTGPSTAGEAAASNIYKPDNPYGDRRESRASSSGVDGVRDSDGHDRADSNSNDHICNDQAEGQRGDASFEDDKPTPIRARALHKAAATSASSSPSSSSPSSAFSPVLAKGGQAGRCSLGLSAAGATSVLTPGLVSSVSTGSGPGRPAPTAMDLGDASLQQRGAPGKDATCDTTNAALGRGQRLLSEGGFREAPG